KAWNFSNNNEYITIADNTPNLVSGAFTLSSWIQPSTLNSTQNIGILGKFNFTVNERSWVLGINRQSRPNNTVFFIVNPTGSLPNPTAITSVAVTTGIWYKLDAFYSPS